MERKQSIKEIQSELGVTGKPGPNLELVNDIADILQQFKHVHGTETDNDAFIFAANVNSGKKIGSSEDDYQLALITSFQGCTVDIVNMFTTLFTEDETIMLAAMQAVQNVAADKMRGGKRG